jgi:large subunit ribosomal protein L4
MTSAQVLDLKGKKLSELELCDAVFGITPNTGVMHTALVRQLANARSGAANTKTRSEVRGGGRKPWKQKGTGRARAGSIRSPLWAGGGVAFGPKPRDYSISLPKKMRVLALKSALASRKEDLVVVKDFMAFTEAKTKAFYQILTDLGLAGEKVLLVLDFACDASSRIQLAARNIEGLKVIHMSNLNVKDLLEYSKILLSTNTLAAVEARFKALPHKACEEATTEVAAKSPQKAEAPKKAPAKKSEAKAEDEAPAKKTRTPKESL